MRKIFLFVLLFGTGMLVLFYFVGRERAHEPRPTPPASPAPTQFTEIPLAKEHPDGKQSAIGVVLDGRQDFTLFTSDDPQVGKPLYRVHADDVDALGGDLYDAKNLSVIGYDPEHGTERFHLTSPLTRLHIPVVGGRFSLGTGEQIELASVELTLNEGAPIVPLTVTVPRLSWHLKQDRPADRFTSTDRVQLDGRGFHAEGTGFDALSETGELALVRDGLVSLALASGGEAVLSATGTGPIQVKREVPPEGGEPQLEMRTTDGARFEVRGGEEPFRLDAQTLHVSGRGATGATRDFRVTLVEAHEDVVAQSRGDSFRARNAEFHLAESNRPERAVLDGGVELLSGGDRFRGELASFEFTPEGRVRTAQMTGTPSGRVQIGRYLPAESGGADLERKLRDAWGDLTGAGPLAVEFAEVTRVDMAGPGKLVIAEIGFDISAAQQLVGTIAKDRTSGALDARGAVRVEYGGSTLATDALALRYELLQPGHEAVVATADGPTTIEGTTPAPGGARGDALTLVAEGGLEARASQGRISVPIARRVKLHVEGPRGFDARSDRVLDLDWDSKTFVAEGDVHYSGAQGDGSATRVTTQGEQSVELVGTDADPARWTLARRANVSGPLAGEVRALSIRAQPDELHARGAVVAELEAGGDRHHLESEAIDVTLDPPADPARPDERTYHALATGTVVGRFVTRGRTGELACDRMRVDGHAHVVDEDAGRVQVGDSDVVGEGNVRITWSGAGGLTGAGDRFQLDRQGRGRLEALDDTGEGRVRAAGTLGGQGLPYAMTARWIESDEQHVEAAEVRIGIDPDAPAPPDEEGRAGKPSVLELSTRRFRADEHEILLDGDAHARGRTPQDQEWTVDAGQVRIEGRFTRGQKLDEHAVQGLEATGGFTAVLADRARASGDVLRGDAQFTRIEGRPARLELRERAGVVLESAWIQYDAENLLLSSDKGTLKPADSQAANPWAITYESLQPFARGENTILVLRNPLFLQGDTQLRALWALFWVDRDEWRRRGERVVKEGAHGPGLRVTVPEQPGVPEKPQRDMSLAERFMLLRQHPAAQVLSEMYLEGNLEITKSGERVARAAAAYLDLKDGRGWAQDADMLQEIRIRNRITRFRAKAQWLNIGPDLSLRADRAVVTSCDYDDPHYVIETHDLRLRPRRRGGARNFFVSAHDNALRFGESWAIPLPPLVAGSDENGYPFIGDLNFGNTARYGTAVRAAFNLSLGPVGRNIGGMFGKFLDLPTVEIPDGRWKLDVGYLGSRGLLLGTGLEYVVRDPKTHRLVFHLDSTIDGIPDNQRDKGLIRVPTDDRPLLRNWFRMRGRYAPTENRWWDLALSHQSDPAVQSEFFEHEFLEYEQKDTYLHYRSSWDDWFFSGSAKVRIEDRTDVDELPSLGILRGRTPIGRLGELDVLYTGQLSAAYLRRHEGNPTYYPPFQDALGDREVLRADTSHRFEMPFDVGFASIKATPWVDGRFTAWDRGADDGSPARAALLAGVDFGTTFWKRYANGSIHALAPSLSLHGDLDVEQSGEPVRFDHLEDPLQGRFVDLSVRSRLWKPENKERFDVEARASYATDLEDGRREGFQPIAVLTEFLTFAGDWPVGFTHDGRYDTRTGDTQYSRTFLGVEPTPEWGLEFGYHLGRDASDEVLYEAATFATRYRATQKWELEFEQSYSLSDSRGLGNTFTLRRLGHDFVMETNIGYRAGEGASFGIDLKPLFAWKRSGLGLIDRWLGVYH